MIRFGYCLPISVGSDLGQIDSYEVLMKVVRECERSGYDSLWVHDHVGGSLLEAWTTISTLSTLTTLRLGTVVLCNNFRAPSILAKMAATLDFISGGRLDFGIGAGDFEEEHRAYGLPYGDASTRIERLEEALEILRRMWTQDKATFEGKYYSIKEASCIPKPVQKPHPPVWLGLLPPSFTSKKKLMVRLAAKYADYCILAHINPTTFRQLSTEIDRFCNEAGRKPGEVGKAWHSSVVISPDKKVVEERVERLKKSSEAWFKHLFKRTLSFEEFSDMNVFGTPDQCLQKVKDFVKAGVKYFILGLSPDRTDINSIQLFSKSVIRTLKKQ